MSEGEERIGEVVGGRYLLERVAGTGGMGVVYRAHDQTADRPVALKLLTERSDADAASFERETEVLRSLSDPVVVSYVDHGTSRPGERFLAMEWIDGVTLADRLEKGPLAISEAVDVAREVARALSSTHARGIVHRDLKPGNVMLEGGDPGRVRLVDFGIALVAEQRGEDTVGEGDVAGTPGYLSPEQARGMGDIGPPSDVFSLGCVLYEALSGRAPFVAPHPLAALAKVLFEQVPRIDKVRAEVPAPLSHLIAQMLEKDPTARPSDGAEVLQELERSSLRTSIPMDELTLTEERGLASVVLARTVDDDPVRPRMIELRREHAKLGFAVELLGDGTLIGTVSGADAATDLVSAAARCANAVQRTFGGPTVLVTGRASLDGGAPVGEAIDRAWAVLRARDGAPAGVVVDETTRQLLRGRWTMEPEGAHHVLGSELLAEPSTQLLGRATPLVGRTRELGLLESALDECDEEELSRVVLVVAQPGGGKSRLRRELIRSWEMREPAPEIWIGRGERRRSESPLAVVASVLRAVFGLHEGDEPADSRTRLRSGLTSRLGAALAGDLWELLAELCGVGPPADEASEALRAARRDPRLMRDRRRAAFASWLEAECDRQTIALVLEDLHVADAPSLRLLEDTLGKLRDSPLLLVGFARPSLYERFPGLWSVHRPTEMRLGPLSKRASEILVRGVLGADAEPAVVSKIIERAEGNPFYLEELIRAVAEGRGGELPATVLAMAQARLSSLEAGDRRLLRAASVFGATFWPSGVASLLGSSEELETRLPGLVKRELVRPRGASTFEGEPEYAFRHELVQEAAYATFGDDDLPLAHAAAARWLVSHGVADATLIADHFELGGRDAEACEWHLRAAESALIANDFAGVVDRAGRIVRDGSVADEEMRGRALGLASEAHRWRGEHELAAQSGERAAELLVEGARAWFHATNESLLAHGRMGQYEAVVDLTARLLHTAARVLLGDRFLDPRRATDPNVFETQIQCLCAAGRTLFHADRYDLADEVRARVGDLVRASGADLPAGIAAQVHGLEASAARHRGDLLGDLRGYQKVLSAWERAGDERNAVNARVSLAFAYLEVGDAAGAERELTEALADAERLGVEGIATRARQNLALAHHYLGNWDEAATLADRVIEESRGRDNARFEGWTTIYRAQIALAAGRVAEAAEIGRRASDLLHISPPAQAGANAVMARALLALGRVEEAREAAASALSVLERLGGIEEFESLVRLAHAEVELAADPVAGAAAAVVARERLEARAAEIDDEAIRASFLTRVPENAATMRLRADARAAQAPERVQAAYDPSAFRREAERVVGLMTEHLEAAIAGTGDVWPERSTPEEMGARWTLAAGEAASEGAAEEVVVRALAGSIRQHHPGYVGYQITTPLPLLAMYEAVGSLLNNGMASFDSGPVNTAAERAAVKWLAAELGWDGGDGVLTSGGSLGNLTAMLAARQMKSGFDAWAEGVGAGPKMAVLASDQAHYSVERAVAITGLGASAAVAVQTDERFRMRRAALEEARARAVDGGRRVLAVVANACSTATGAVDPLDEVADFCAEHDLWMHVDAAHGGSLLLSDRLKPRLAGLQRADSLVWDAHKLMLVPALSTAVLFRDGAHGFAAFRQKAPYLYGQHDAQLWDAGQRTVECTKRAIGLTLFAAIQTYGRSFFGEYVESVVGAGERFAARVAASTALELAVEPECNIVCFRVASEVADPESLDALQDAVRESIQAEGRFFIGRTRLRERVWLRVTIGNPFTEDEHLDALVERLERAATELRT